MRGPRGVLWWKWEGSVFVTEFSFSYPRSPLAFFKKKKKFQFQTCNFSERVTLGLCSRGPPKTNEVGGILKGELGRKGLWEGGNRRELGNLIGTPDKLSPPPSNLQSTSWPSLVVVVGVFITV